MGLLGKDWNIVTVTFERADLFRINGNRGRGGDAVKMRDNARRHARTLYWAVYDQKGRLLQGEAGPGRSLVPSSVMERLLEEVKSNESLRQVLALLKGGKNDKAARQLVWSDDGADAAPAASRPGPQGTYTLLIRGTDGEELESSLRLSQTEGGLGGVIVSPEGEETAIHDARFDNGELWFEMRFDDPQSPALLFHGRVLEHKRVVKGSFAG